MNMRKVKCVMVSAALIVMVSSYNVWKSYEKVVLPDLILANVEALAEVHEADGGASCSASANCANGSVSCNGVRCQAHLTYVVCYDRKGNMSTSRCA